MLIEQLTDYCDRNFKPCGECKNNCTHPSGKCSGSCADCLHEIQYHRHGGRSEYNCRNMLRYYTCHTAWKRCSEMLYALETINLQKYPEFNILSIGCGAAPDLMAFEQISGGRRMTYHGIDILPEWDEIHGFIEWNTDYTHNKDVSFDRRDVYEMLTDASVSASPYNVIILQYMIAGHIHNDRTDRIDLLFDLIVDKLILHKSPTTPLLLIINDINHKSWICDYFNLFAKKLREHKLVFNAEKRHFEPREDGENAGSQLYKARSNRFLPLISAHQRDTYNAHAPCSAAQLIVEVT